jgi:hypothetical protein
MKRELGFYWVKRSGYWRVAEYTKSFSGYADSYVWYLCGSEWVHNDSEFEEIN